MQYTGAEIIIKSLEREGIDIVAGIPGGSNLPLYNALYHSRIRHVLARHEQAAGFIAQGMARTTGKAAVCFATSGPGVTNLLTAIADAKLDSVPVVAITGQVPSGMIGTDAFQEVGTYGMTMHITKHNYLVKDARDLLYIIPEAFEIAQNGRPGPVVIDVPKDIQTALVEIGEWPEFPRHRYRPIVNRGDIERIAAMINSSARPVIYAGGGIINAEASRELDGLARKSSIPVALTLMGLGAFSPDDPLYLGMLGMHGARATNYALDEADLLIVLGARFDDRAIGRAAEFCPRASIVHIDIDHSEIDKIRKTNISTVADVKTALEALIPLIEPSGRHEWNARIRKLKESHPFPAARSSDPFQPMNFIGKIAEIAGPEAIVATDVGQHQMWVAQAYPFRRPRTLLTSGGLGTMGFGFPTAIGAALAHPDRKVICVSGDGSFQMNIQELATLAELACNVKIFVMNNQHLGLVRQQQELFFDRNYIASRFGARINFASIAREYGLRSLDLRESADPFEEVAAALDERGPCLIDVPIDYAENVFPMVPPGAANREMIECVS